MGPAILSTIERLSSSRRSKNVLLLWELIVSGRYKLQVLSREVVLFSECPLSEVPLYKYTCTHIYPGCTRTHIHTQLCTPLTKSTPTFITPVSGNEFSYIGKYTFINNTYTSILPCSHMKEFRFHSAKL